MTGLAHRVVAAERVSWSNRAVAKPGCSDHHRPVSLAAGIGGEKSAWRCAPVAPRPGAGGLAFLAFPFGRAVDDLVLETLRRRPEAAPRGLLPPKRAALSAAKAPGRSTTKTLAAEATPATCCAKRREGLAALLRSGCARSAGLRISTASHAAAHQHPEEDGPPPGWIVALRARTALCARLTAELVGTAEGPLASTESALSGSGSTGAGSPGADALTTEPAGTAEGPLAGAESALSGTQATAADSPGALTTEPAGTAESALASAESALSGTQATAADSPGALTTEPAGTAESALASAESARCGTGSTAAGSPGAEALATEPAGTAEGPLASAESARCGSGSTAAEALTTEPAGTAEGPLTSAESALSGTKATAADSPGALTTEPAGTAEGPLAGAESILSTTDPTTAKALAAAKPLIGSESALRSSLALIAGVVKPDAALTGIALLERLPINRLVFANGRLRRIVLHLILTLFKSLPRRITKRQRSEYLGFCSVPRLCVPKQTARITRRRRQMEQCLNSLPVSLIVPCPNPSDAADAATRAPRFGPQPALPASYSALSPRRLPFANRPKPTGGLRDPAPDLDQEETHEDAGKGLPARHLSAFYFSIASHAGAKESVFVR